jgi:phosphoenolpyruvate carboxykinase (GTP)
MASLCKPDSIVLYSGTKEEYDRLADLLVSVGTFKRLNPNLRPNSFLANSDPADTARVEEKTFICSRLQDDAGPTNNWVDPQEMKSRLTKLFDGCMRGRTMYVVPYLMGPEGSPYSRVGVELTDSAYVVLNMSLIARTGRPALDALKTNDEFVRCLHSCGSSATQSACYAKTWPCDPAHMAIVHFPEDRLIWSYGSGYGGNALLNKKCFALRIASCIARDEGWLAEHMMILSVTNPRGEKKYFAGAFPSACGKTNLAMVKSSLPGWQVKTVGDDIAWMHFGSDGRLYAINPEAGFFGVAPNTSSRSNSNAMDTLTHDTIFTNCALTPDGDIWWEGIGYEAPAGTIDWTQQCRDNSAAVANVNGCKKDPLCHPNARFTTSAAHCPSMDEDWENPHGVPISAILFGGRRSTTIPLVCEARNWTHGVFLGANLSSETTAAAAGQVGRLRRDPFAMLPFCGYNIGDYFAHWISMASDTSRRLPKIYQVNWFKKDPDGHFLWPGYSDNMRVLKWIFERCDGEHKVQDTALGGLPYPEDIDTKGLNMSEAALGDLLTVQNFELSREIDSMRNHLTAMGPRVPASLFRELAFMEKKCVSD